MASGVSGYVEITAGLPRYKIRLAYSEEYDVASNTSALTIRPFLFPQSPPYVDAYPDLTISVAGTPVITTDSWSGNYRIDWMGEAIPYPMLQNGNAISSRITGLRHNNDGTLSVALSVYGNTYSSAMIYFGDGTSMSANGSATVALTSIPRATPISANVSSVPMGADVTFSMPRYVASYTHRVTYQFGSASGVLATAAGNSLTWTVPLSLAAQIPAAASGVCTVTCQTYNGGTLVGTTTVNITLTVPDSVVPLITGQQLQNVSTSAVVAGWGLSGFTQGYSQLKVSAALAAQYSTIAEYTVNYGQGSFSGAPGTASANIVHTSGVLNSTGTFGVLISVRDARGRTASAYVGAGYTVHAYSQPTISNIVAQRYSTDPAIKDDDGTNLAVKAAATCSSVNGNNSISAFRFRFKPRNTDTWSGYYPLTNDVYFTLDGALATTTSYLLEISATDKLTSADPVQTIVATAQTTINAKVGGDGVAFGVYSTIDNSVEIAPNWTLIMSDDSSGGTVTLTASKLKQLLSLIGG